MIVSHCAPRVGVERGHVDHVLEGAARSREHGGEIGEGELDLLGEIRLGRPVWRLPTWPETNKKPPERIAAE